MSEALHSRSRIDSFLLEWSKPLNSRLYFVSQDVTSPQERMSNMRRFVASAAASARGSAKTIKEGEVEQTLRAIGERERR